MTSDVNVTDVTVSLWFWHLSVTMMCSLNRIILILNAYELNIPLFDCKYFTNYNIHSKCIDVYNRLHCRFQPTFLDSHIRSYDCLSLPFFQIYHLILYIVVFVFVSLSLLVSTSVERDTTQYHLTMHVSFTSELWTIM